MKRRRISPVEIRNQGLEALVKALGPVGMARFLQQFDTGSGNYTKNRVQWLEKVTVQEAVEEIKRSRRAGN